MVGEDGAELERERVERALELVCGEEQRRREAGVVPRRDAAAQARRSSAVSVSTTASVARGGVAVRSAVACRAAVGDQRLQAIAEDRRAGRDRAREPRRESAIRQL